MIRNSKSEIRNSIVVVSGLPRAGTSMMMKMLEAGGLDVLTDEIREADVDNPEGYYEFERVKQLKDRDTAWVSAAQGKVVKVIAALLEHLPADYAYKVLFMHRAMPEMLASQRKMLIRRGEDPDRISDDEMAEMMERHVQRIKVWLGAQSHFQVLDVDYNAVLADPEPYVHQINAFLGGFLDERAMASVVDPQLYRNRMDEQPNS